MRFSSLVGEALRIYNSGVYTILEGGGRGGCRGDDARTKQWGGLPPNRCRYIVEGFLHLLKTGKYEGLRFSSLVDEALQVFN